MFDPAYPHGRHYYWKAWKLPPLTDSAIDVIVEQAAAITSPLSAIPIFTLGGAVARVEDDATASLAAARRTTSTSSRRGSPTIPSLSEHKAWARTAWEAMRPFAYGVYVNFMSDEPTRQVQMAYGTQVRPAGCPQGQGRPVERLPLQPEHCSGEKR